jgi:copper chaperone CopZ
VQLFKDAIKQVLSKLEGERRSFNNNSRGGDSVVMVVEIAVVEKTVVVETEEDIPFY